MPERPKNLDSSLCPEHLEESKPLQELFCMFVCYSFNIHTQLTSNLLGTNETFLSQHTPIPNDSCALSDEYPFASDLAIGADMML